MRCLRLLTSYLGHPPTILSDSVTPSNKLPGIRGSLLLDSVGGMMKTRQANGLEY